MPSSVFLIIVNILIIIGGCEGSFKIKRNTQNGCIDKHKVDFRFKNKKRDAFFQIDDPESVKFPRMFHTDFARPWVRKDINAQLYNSKSLTYNWYWMKELRIRGLNRTISEFLGVLEKGGCLFIPYGEAIKDLLTGSIKDTSPLKIEGESTCNVNKVKIKKFV